MTVPQWLGSKRTIKVIDGNLSGNKNLGGIERIPQRHNGWESVTYQGKRYQLFGGIRTDEFIDLANPIK